MRQASPRALSWLSLSVSLLAACGDDKSNPRDGSDDGNDGGPGECTTFRSDPRGAASPTDLNPAPSDDGAEVVFDAEAVPLDEVVFPNGVQAGEMTSTGAMLWTRAVGPDAVRVRVWRETDTAGTVALVREAEFSVADGDIAKIGVGDLAPNTLYRYAFFVVAEDTTTLTARSRIGRLRTALDAGEVRALRIAATTCVGSESDTDKAQLEPYPALSLMGMEETDFIVHLGDVSYSDGSTSLADYRESWAHTFSQQGYRDLLASTGMYATWDDHEVEDNWTDADSTVSDAQFMNARQVFDEYMATARTAADPIWGAYAWGDTVEVIVLDLRSERDATTAGTPDARFISDEQMAFLKERLSGSTAHFKLVMSSVNIANLAESGGWDIPLGLNDRWEGYAAQREELLDYIVDEGIDNVWFLAGDIHMGFVGRLEPEGHPYARMWEITVGPGASSVNPNALAYESNIGLDREDVFPCNQFVFGHGKRQVATYLALDPGADTIRVTFVDALTDEVLFDEVMRQEDD